MPRREKMYEELLKEWCDTLVKLQITERQEEFLYGGIICPNCARIHGRCGDAIYPMMEEYSRTGEKKYLRCAKLLFSWTEKNMIHSDGSMQNDTNSDWKGITVFYVTQLGETLLHYADLLDEETKKRWRARFFHSAAYLRDYIWQIGGNINYPITCSYAMAVAWELTGEEGYKKKAEELSDYAEAHLTEHGILYGEGKPTDMISKKGCRPVDLGYNVEESLPALSACAQILGKQKLLEKVKKSMAVHLEFMLPDGAWDNSWGTRNNKWTYWGSRTSDGCQSGYGRFAIECPEFAEAVYRNTMLLKHCTHDGLLYGGPMYQESGELPCVHHTICHAKALADLVRNKYFGYKETKETISLPRECQEPIRFFPDMDVTLLREGDFYATVSGYDVEYSKAGHATGGTVTLLYHKKFGPIVAAGMNRYYLVEPNNMQFFRKNSIICTTPRLEWNGFSSMEEKEAIIETNEKIPYYSDPEKEYNGCVVEVHGRLKDEDGRADAFYHFTYKLTENSFLIEGEVLAEKEKQERQEWPYFYMPLISPHTEQGVPNGKNGFFIKRQGVLLKFMASHTIEGLDQGQRGMNPVGGFEVIPIRISFRVSEKFFIKLQVSEESNF